MGLNDKFNHRGHRALRDKNRQRFSVQGTMEKPAIFSTLLSRPGLPRGSHGMISALSASSPFIFTVFSSGRYEKRKVFFIQN
jgi:hypothetical protein